MAIFVDSVNRGFEVMPVGENQHYRQNSKKEQTKKKEQYEKESRV